MTDEMAGDSPGPDGADDRDNSRTGARLMAELRQAQARADRAERELDRTKRSASYVVGNMLVRAAKDPRRLITLPRDLWRVWRLRKARRTAPAAAVARTRAVVDLDAARLLVPRLTTAAPGRGMSIVGAIASATARGWSPYAAVSPALPHEAAALVEAADPDVVIIDTSAALTGEDWSHLGSPAAADRLLAAGALVDAAHALGRPAVLLRMTPPSHTAYLDALAQRCDLVVDGPGSASRSTRWHPGIDPLEQEPLPVLPALLDLANWPAVGDSAPARVTMDPALPHDVAWSRALGSATGVLDKPLEPGIIGLSIASAAALAAGRRVMRPDDHDLAHMLDRWPEARDAVSITADPARLAALAASGPRPLSDDERRAVLAALLLTASAPVQLTILAHELKIASRPRSLWDVALVVEPGADIDRVLAQSWRPREVVVTEPLSDRANDTLTEAGIEVVLAPPASLREPALLGVASPFVAFSVDSDNPHDLVELLAGHLLGQPTRAHVTDARLVGAR